VAGDQVAERREDQHPVHGSCTDPAIGYQLEQGRALAIALGAHQTRDLEESGGSLEIALHEANTEPVPDSLLARSIGQLANDLGGAVSTADRPNTVDSWDRDTGCTAGHRRGAFQPVQESDAVTIGTAVALPRRSLVDTEDTIDVLGPPSDSIETRWSGALTQSALWSTGCRR
jgi:hypothetical protein